MARLIKYLPVTARKKSPPGYCTICEGPAAFREIGPWLRDDYRCSKCDSIPRQRSIVHAMNRFMPGWKALSIHESSPSGPTLKYFLEKCARYSYSQYFTHVPPGSYSDGVRCEDLERLTFGDSTFDVFITQDVFEHVLRPDRAFSEIERVLKPGGAHVFTVPLYRDIERSRPRVRVSGDKVEHLMKPVYHGNPIDPDGSLVTWDYGADLPELIHRYSGLYTTICYFNDRRLGIDGEFLEVFITKKREGGTGR